MLMRDIVHRICCMCELTWSAAQEVTQKPLDSVLLDLPREDTSMINSPALFMQQPPSQRRGLFRLIRCEHAHMICTYGLKRPP